MNAELSVREIRERLHRMNAEFEEIHASLDAKRTRVVRARHGRWREAVAVPRSPWTHATSEVPFDHELPWAWKALGRAMFWLYGDARRRVRSADRELAKLDSAKPALEHLKMERRKS